MLSRKPFFFEDCKYSDNVLQLNWKSQGMNKSRMFSLIPGEGKYCLEVGPGKREQRSAVEDIGYKWVGLDIAEGTNISVRGDAHALPLKDAAFDLVVMDGVLEHVENPWVVLREVHRVLKEGGTFWGTAAFLTPFHDSYFHFSHWGLELLLKESGFTPLEICPGANVFLSLTHSLTGAQMNPGKEALLAQLIARPIFFLRRAIGLLYVKARYGRNSEEFDKFANSRLYDPLRFAGVIMFLTQKQGYRGGGR